MISRSTLILSFNVPKVLSQRLLSSTQSGVLHEKSVRIRTCKNVYSNMGDKKPFLFRKCPSSGIDMTVKYVDSLPSASYNAPTVLAVHGTPGSYSDFSPLLDQLSSNGFRVVSPCMPGYQFTNETQTFRHTTEEKVEFLDDWLSEINVNRVDVAIMHSSACYPALELWKGKQDVIKSLVMINPPGHRTIKAMKPEFYTSFAARINTHPLGKKLFKALGGTKPFRGVRNDPANAENAIFACQTMHYAKKERMIELMNKVRETQTPMLYFYSEKDKLIDTAIFHELLDMLGADQSIVCDISKTGETVREASADHDWLRVLCVKDGGHYAFKSCADTLEKEITKLLAQVYMTDVLRPFKPGTDDEWWESMNRVSGQLYPQ